MRPRFSSLALLLLALAAPAPGRAGDAASSCGNPPVSDASLAARPPEAPLTFDTAFAERAPRPPRAPRRDPPRRFAGRHERLTESERADDRPGWRPSPLEAAWEAFDLTTAMHRIGPRTADDRRDLLERRPLPSEDRLDRWRDMSDRFEDRRDFGAAPPAWVGERIDRRGRGEGGREFRAGRGPDEGFAGDRMIGHGFRPGVRRDHDFLRGESRLHKPR